MNWLLTRRRLLFSAAIALMSGAEGCAIIGGGDVTDLKLLSIEIVDVKDRPEMWFGGRAPLSRPVLSISFSTQTDLAAFSERYEYNVSGRVSECTSDAYDEMKMLGVSLVSDESGSVGFRSLAQTSPRSGAKSYRMNVYAHSVDLAGGGPAYRYDLLRDPKDLCAIVRGGNMAFRTFSSNTLIVPKATLVEAKARQR